MRQAEVYLYDRLAGHLTEDEEGYTFQYDDDYLANDPVKLSVNFPLHNGKFHDNLRSHLTCEVATLPAGRSVTL